MLLIIDLTSICLLFPTTHSEQLWRYRKWRITKMRIAWMRFGVGHKVCSGFSVLRCYGLLWVPNELCGQSDIYTWVSFRAAHAKIFRDICSLHLKVLLSSGSSKRKCKNVEDCIQGIHGSDLKGADITAAHILLARIHSRGRLRNTASLFFREEKEVATQEHTTFCAM